VVSLHVLSATNNNGPAFAHFPESISHVAPLEDAAIVAIVSVAAIIAAIIVVVVDVADALIESPVIVVLVVLWLSSLIASFLSCRAAPAGCCFAASLSHWMVAGG
jgi:hypothetical protein